MHALLKDLIELQEQDSQLLILRAQLAEFPRRFAAMDERLASARGNVEQAKAAKSPRTKSAVSSSLMPSCAKPEFPNLRASLPR